MSTSSKSKQEAVNSEQLPSSRKSRREGKQYKAKRDRSKVHVFKNAPDAQAQAKPAFHATGKAERHRQQNVRDALEDMGFDPEQDEFLDASVFDQIDGRPQKAADNDHIDLEGFTDLLSAPPVDKSKKSLSSDSEVRKPGSTPGGSPPGTPPGSPPSSDDGTDSDDDDALDEYPFDEQTYNPLESWPPTYVRHRFRQSVRFNNNAVLLCRVIFGFFDSLAHNALVVLLNQVLLHDDTTEFYYESRKLQNFRLVDSENHTGWMFHGVLRGDNRINVSFPWSSSIASRENSIVLRMSSPAHIAPLHHILPSSDVTTGVSFWNHRGLSWSSSWESALQYHLGQVPISGNLVMFWRNVDYDYAIIGGTIQISSNNLVSSVSPFTININNQIRLCDTFLVYNALYSNVSTGANNVPIKLPLPVSLVSKVSGMYSSRQGVDSKISAFKTSVQGLCNTYWLPTTDDLTMDRVSDAVMAAANNSYQQSIPIKSYLRRIADYFGVSNATDRFNSDIRPLSNVSLATLGFGICGVALFILFLRVVIGRLEQKLFNFARKSFDYFKFIRLRILGRLPFTGVYIYYLKTFKDINFVNDPAFTNATCLNHNADNTIRISLDHVPVSPVSNRFIRIPEPQTKWPWDLMHTTTLLAHRAVPFLRNKHWIFVILPPPSLRSILGSVTGGFSKWVKWNFYDWQALPKGLAPFTVVSNGELENFRVSVFTKDWRPLELTNQIVQDYKKLELQHRNGFSIYPKVLAFRDGSRSMATARLMFSRLRAKAAKTKPKNYFLWVFAIIGFLGGVGLALLKLSYDLKRVSQPRISSKPPDYSPMANYPASHNVVSATVIPPASAAKYCSWDTAHGPPTRPERREGAIYHPPKVLVPFWQASSPPLESCDYRRLQGERFVEQYVYNLSFAFCAAPYSPRTMAVCPHNTDQAIRCRVVNDMGFGLEDDAIRRRVGLAYNLFRTSFDNCLLINYTAMTPEEYANHFDVGYKRARYNASLEAFALGFKQINLRGHEASVFPKQDEFVLRPHPLNADIDSLVSNDPYVIRSITNSSTLAHIAQGSHVYPWSKNMFSKFRETAINLVEVPIIAEQRQFDTLRFAIIPAVGLTHDEICDYRDQAIEICDNASSPVVFAILLGDDSEIIGSWFDHNNDMQSFYVECDISRMDSSTHASWMENLFVLFAEIFPHNVSSTFRKRVTGRTKNEAVYVIDGTNPSGADYTTVSNTLVSAVCWFSMFTTVFHDQPISERSLVESFRTFGFKAKAKVTFFDDPHDLVGHTFLSARLFYAVRNNQPGLVMIPKPLRLFAKLFWSRDYIALNDRYLEVQLRLWCLKDIVKHIPIFRRIWLLYNMDNFVANTHGEALLRVQRLFYFVVSPGIVWTDDATRQFLDFYQLSPQDLEHLEDIIDKYDPLSRSTLLIVGDQLSLALNKDL